ncbi:MAG TPA: carbohydrate kinase family protein [Nitrososphaerales archaeon]|nr:carbohydrate kinase family protein [Nitrososphaerales archaeon]
MPLEAPGSLVVLGAINLDTTVFVRRFAESGEEVAVKSAEESPGGKGANAAVAAARILGPNNVAIVGALGTDATGVMLRRSLRAEGVTDRGIARVRGTPSGRAYIVVDGRGGKVIHTLFGANEKLRPDHLQSSGARRALSSAHTVLVMDVPIPVALAAARTAKGVGASLIYSPGVRSSLGVKALEDVLALADVLVIDRSELSNLSGPRDPAGAASHLQASFPGLTVVATLGPLGCVVVVHGNLSVLPGVDLAGLGLKAVNSTGSGDAFLGAFTSYRMLGRPHVEAAKLGNLAGALKATKTETRGSPTRAELEKTMEALGRVRQPRRGSPSKRASPRSRRRS